MPHRASGRAAARTSACPRSDRRGSAAARCPRSCAVPRILPIDGRRAVTLKVLLLPGQGCAGVPRPKAPDASPADGRATATAPPRPGRARRSGRTPTASCRTRIAHATSGGASIEPNDAPMLNTPPARPRSCAGNHSDVAFIPAGFAEPSASPSSPRSQKSAVQLPARPCAMLMSDQATAKMAKPSLRPMTSST